MKTLVLRGSKQTIADEVARIDGEVREAIVFVEETPSVAEMEPPDREDIFAEMFPYLVEVPDVDDSRQAIYSRMEGE